MKKWLKRSLLGLLGILILLAGAVGLLLGTQPGLQWALQTGNKFLPGEFSFMRLEGNLLGELRLHGLEYRNPEMVLQVDDLLLTWVPSELLDRMFHLRELTLEKVRFEQLGSGETAQATAAPLELPDLALPLALKLDLVQVRQVEIISAAEADPVKADHLLLRAAWDDSGLRFDELKLLTPEVEFLGQGTLLPKGKYPVEFQTDWRLEMEETPKVQATGTIAGDLQKLTVRQRLQGDMAAELTTHLHELLGKLNWEVDLNVTRFPALLLPPETAVDVLAVVKAQGDLQQADTQISLRVQESGSAARKPAGETLQAAEHTLQLAANVVFSDLRFQLQGDWKNQQWPLAGAPMVIANAGKLQASGTAENYVFNLGSSIQGDEIPPGEWNAKGQGNLEQLVLESLHGDILDGSVDISGKLAWVPQLSWEAAIVTTDIDPGKLNPEWPGKLSLTASSRGEMKDNKLQLEAILKELSGTLHEKQVAGSGRFRIAGDKYILEDVALSSGSARVKAEGELGNEWNLGWRLEVPDLADLLPGGGGMVQGEGRLTGTQESPVFDAELAIRALHYEDLSWEEGDVQFSVGMDTAHQSSVSVTAVNLARGGEIIESLALQVTGPLDKHTLELMAKHPRGNLQLAAGGGYFEDKSAWEGELQRLQLDTGDFGNWGLRAPAPLLLSADKVKVDSVCLQEQQTELCALTDWSPEGGKADLTLRSFSLERLKPWLPPEITALEGILGMEARVDLGEAINANIEVVLEPGIVTYLDHAANPVQLDHRNGKLTAVLDDKQLEAGWKLEVGEHLATGEFLVPRAELDKDPLTAPLSGRVDLAIRKLGLLTAFVPLIEKGDGSVTAELKLGGVLGDPKISGQAVLEATQITVPRAGLVFREVNFQVNGKGGNRLDITGVVTSGEGTMKLEGSVALDAQQGWPAKLSLNGEEFQLANLPEAQILISPNLTLDSNKEVIKLRGALAIPKALVVLRDLPPGSQDISSDVVMVDEADEMAEEFEKSRLDAEVVIKLGDDVRFNGLGLRMALGGELTFNEVPGKIPTANGELKIKSGSFRAYGQDLNIETGRVSYAGGRLDNPGIRLRASRKFSDTTVGVDVTGTAKKPQFSGFSSDPDMTEKDAISMLLTGQASGDLSSAKIYAGKQITPDLSVGVNLGGGEEGSEFVTRYRLRNNVNLEGTSSAKKSGGSINYTIDIE